MEVLDETPFAQIRCFIRVVGVKFYYERHSVLAVAVASGSGVVPITPLESTRPIRLALTAPGKSPTCRTR
jgi:hypothetical protein